MHTPSSKLDLSWYFLGNEDVHSTKLILNFKKGLPKLDFEDVFFLGPSKVFKFNDTQLNWLSSPSQVEAFRQFFLTKQEIG